MENTNLSNWLKTACQPLCPKTPQRNNKHSNERKAWHGVLMLSFVLCSLLIPDLALAQSGSSNSGFFCVISKYLKEILGSAAVLAIVLWAIDHIFNDEKVHAVAVRVGVATAVVSVAAVVIAQSGFTVSCAF